MRTMLLFAFLGIAFSSAAQQRYTINPGQSIGDVLGEADLSMYPEFKQGVVRFRDGFLQKTRLNYSFLDGALRFIGPKGDTLVLTGTSELELAAVGADTFYFHDQVFRLLQAVPQHGRLLQRQYLQWEGSARTGGYGANDPLGAIESVTQVQDNASIRQLTVSERRIISRRAEPFLWPAGARPEPASRKLMEKVFPDRKAVLDAYLRDHKVDWKNMEQVKQVFAYLAA